MLNIREHVCIDEKISKSTLQTSTLTAIKTNQAMINNTRTMKHFYLLQCCVGALCIASFVETHHHGHLHMTEQPKTHRIQKRQADSSQVDCGLVVHDEYCTNGLYQDAENVFQRCNFSTTLLPSCRPNYMGGYCSFLNQRNIILERNATRLCLSSNLNCSHECRDLLIQIRSELGCCIQSVFNNSNNPSSSYAYSLWSSCGLEPVTQECPPSTIMLISTPVDPTCNNNFDAALQLLYSTICKHQYNQSVWNRLSLVESCQNYSTPSTEFSVCASNRLDRYCVSINPSTIKEYFTEASESCQNTSACDPYCIETLNNITNTVGCCFNDQYNSTSSPIDWLSYEFWSRCDLTSPGFCEIRLVDDITTSTNYRDQFTTPWLTTGTSSSNSSFAVLILTIASICAVLLVATVIAIVVICALKAISKRKSVVAGSNNQEQAKSKRTASQHTDNVEGEEADQEEHVYDYIKETDKDLELKQNVSYSVLFTQKYK